MKKNTLRIAAVLSAVLCLSLLFASCVKKENPPADGTTTAAVTEKTPDVTVPGTADDTGSQQTTAEATTVTEGPTETAGPDYVTEVTNPWGDGDEAVTDNKSFNY